MPLELRRISNGLTGSQPPAAAPVTGPRRAVGVYGAVTPPEAPAPPLRGCRAAPTCAAAPLTGVAGAGNPAEAAGKGALW